MTTLGIIPARAGSKRVPGKNSRLLGPSPLIVWTISSALLTDGLDEVVVTSDDDDILSIANQYPLTALRRPRELASDTASSYDVILHAVDALGPFENICLLQPTSPFRMPTDTENCLSLHNFGMTGATVSVRFGKKEPNGAVYVGRMDWLRDMLSRGFTHPFDHEYVTRFSMPAWRSLDIDTEEDFQEAEEIADRILSGEAGHDIR